MPNKKKIIFLPATLSLFPIFYAVIFWGDFFLFFFSFVVESLTDASRETDTYAFFFFFFFWNPFLVLFEFSSPRNFPSCCCCFFVFFPPPNLSLLLLLFLLLFFFFFCFACLPKFLPFFSPFLLFFPLHDSRDFFPPVYIAKQLRGK